jgi:hypothetical protein
MRLLMKPFAALEVNPIPFPGKPFDKKSTPVPPSALECQVSCTEATEYTQVIVNTLTRWTPLFAFP